MYCMNYVIRKGDTLYTISRQFHVSLSEIIKANPLVNVYNLMLGETICIPVSTPSSQTVNFISYSVKEGDTLGSLLTNYGANLADLMQLNTLDQIYLLPGSTLQVPVTEEGESEAT